MWLYYRNYILSGKKIVPMTTIAKIVLDADVK